MAEVSASLVVRFSDGTATDGSVSAEIDSRDNGLNAGKTSFNPGDDVGFLVYLSDGVVIKSVEASLGVIAAQGDQVISDSQYLQFAKTKEASINAAATGNVPGVWVGNNGGAVVAANGKATIPAAIVGMFYATIAATAKGYKLTNVPAAYTGVDEIEVLIVITAEKLK